MSPRSSDEALAVSIYQQFVDGLRDHQLLRDQVERRVSLEMLIELQEQARQLCPQINDGIVRTNLEVMLHRRADQALLISRQDVQLV